jgi:cytochrome oxidase Cu insertion factor (SCO1/SenC/PrrC family)
LTRTRHFSLDELETLIKIENKKQCDSNAKLRISEDTPDDLQEIIKSYLKQYSRYDDEMIRVLGV